MVRVAEIELSGRTVLRCAGCAEELVLIGLEEDWRSEGRTTFGCAGCGEELILDHRLGDKELTMREVGVPPGGASGGP